MDRSERLKVLFEKEDALLKTDTHLHTLPTPPSLPEIDPKPSVEVLQLEANTKTEQPIPNKTFGPEPLPAMASESEEELDDYLLACKHTAERKARDALRDASLITSKKSGKKNHRPRTMGKAGSKTSDMMIDTSEAPLSRCFCPLMAVSRLPYKYIRGEASDSIANQFFTEGKFWKRYWDLYYIYPPSYMASRPLLLTPAVQVQQLIDEINDEFRCALSLPTDIRLGLVLPFHDDGTPQPRFLGQCTSREMKDQLELSIPSPSHNRDDHNPPAGCSPEVDRSFAAFRKKIEAGLEAVKSKTKAARAKKRQGQIERQQGWSRALRRSQRYLGLRPRRPHNILPPKFDDNVTWEDRQKAEREYGLACGTILPPLDVDEPAPFPFSDEPIFICVDVESNERCHDQITEIGISILDTLDLIGIPPGDAGNKWIARIRSRHFRINERSYIVNKDFIAGCPDKFEFGESEWISISDAVKVVDDCFQPPYSAHVELAFQGQDGKEGISAATEDAIPEYKMRPRNIVFLGHDTQTDIKYLRTLGSTLFTDSPEPSSAFPESSSSDANLPTTTQRPNFLEALDTATLFRVLKRDTHPRSLAQVLLDVGLTGWYLHNAGNDARYTMEAMIRIVLKSRLLLDKAAQNEAVPSSSWPLGGPRAKNEAESHEDNIGISLDWKTEVERRVAESVAETETRVREDCEGWELDEWTAEDVDGGEGKGIQLSNADEQNRTRENKRAMRAAKNPGNVGRAWPEASIP